MERGKKCKMDKIMGAGMVSGQGVQIFLEKIRRKAPKFF